MRPTRSWKVAAVAAVLAITGLAACDPPPPPVVLTVNTYMDLPDTDPGNGTCDATFSGIPFCSLRAAVQEANASHIDRIEVSAQALHLTSTLVVDPIAPTLTVIRTQGTGRAVIEDHGGPGPLLDVQGGGLVLSSVSLGGADAAALHVASGATAVVHDGIVSGGTTGVDAEGSVLLVGSAVRDNGGIGVDVGTGGRAGVLRSALIDNGIGLWVTSGGSASVDSSTLSGNSSGILNLGAVDLRFATVAANNAGGVVGTSVSATGSILVGTATGPDCGAPVTSGGWNALGTGCGTATGTDVAAGADDLETLSDDDLPVHRVSVGSDLVGRIPLGSGPCAGGIVDQLGAPRATDGTCTPGAVDASLPTGLLVTSAADGHDADPGDGTCATSTGTCTLRASLEEAATIVPPLARPTVPVAPGIDPVLDPSLGRIAADRVRIVGAAGSDPTIIDAAGTGGVLRHCTSDLLVEDVTITGAAGAAIASGCPEDDPDGRIDLNRVTLTGNGSGITGDSYTGNLRLFVNDSDISDNAGDGIGVDFTQVAVTSSRLTGNGAGGIGLGEHSSSISVTDSVISGNQFGISVQYGGITVTRSLIADHTQSGISTSAGGVQVVDSTISGNAAGVDEGFDGSTTFRRSTLVGNGVAYRSFDDNLVSVTFAGSVVQGGVACAVGNDTTIVSQGFNVVSDASCGLTGTGDQQGVDALLGPLADNGGPTPTHLPAAGSPAIDAIPAGTANLCTGTLVDQRGVSRPQGPACDRGAVEQ